MSCENMSFFDFIFAQTTSWDWLYNVYIYRYILFTQISHLANTYIYIYIYIYIFTYICTYIYIYIYIYRLLKMLILYIYIYIEHMYVYILSIYILNLFHIHAFPIFSFNLFFFKDLFLSTPWVQSIFFLCIMIKGISMNSICLGQSFTPTSSNNNCGVDINFWNINCKK